MRNLARSIRLQPRRLGIAVVLVATAILVQTCKLDELVTSPDSGTLALSPVQLLDSAAVGSRSVLVRTLEITHTGPSALSWTARRAQGSAWLVLSATNGTAPSTESVFLNPAGLPVGVYYDTIIVSLASSPSDPTRIPVRFTIRPCAVESIALGAGITDSLVESDCEAPHRTGRSAKLFRLSATSGDSVTIVMRSTAFDAYLIVDNPGSGLAQPLAEAGDCLGATGDPCLIYLLLPRSGTYVVEATAADAQGGGAFTLEITVPRPPASPAALQQLVRDSTTTVAPGASVADTVVVFRARVTDPDTVDLVRLEVEVQPVGTAFTDVATSTGDAVRPDSNALAMVGGLLDDTEYHWQVRAVDQTGRASAWLSFGGNPETVADFRIAV
ncbi:MAG: hypothetical protein V3T28_01575, partial [Gemmatimonadales bacterium]